MTCPDCAGPVDTAQLRDPDGPGSVTIWDCPRCQRAGIVTDQQPAAEPVEPVLDPVFFPGSERPEPPRLPGGRPWPAAAGEYPPRRRR